MLKVKRQLRLPTGIDATDNIAGITETAEVFNYLYDVVYSLTSATCPKVEKEFSSLFS